MALRTYRRRAGAALALVVAIGVVIAIVLTTESPTPASGGTTGSTASGATTVQRRNLVEEDTESGTLSYAGPQTVYNRLSGTITWLPNAGQVIHPGQALFRVDDVPVLLMDGSTPAYRALEPSDGDGPDITELNRNLVQLGFDPDPIVVDDEWQAATTAGIDLLQYTLGESETGTLALGRVVFLPGPQLVSTVDGTVGSTGGGGSTGASLIDPAPHIVFVDATPQTTSTPATTTSTTPATITTPATTTPTTTPTTTTPATPGTGTGSTTAPATTTPSTGTTTATTPAASKPGKHAKHGKPKTKRRQPSTSQLTLQTLEALLRAEEAQLRASHNSPSSGNAPSSSGSSPSSHSSTTPSHSSTTPSSSTKSPSSSSHSPSSSSSANSGGGSATEILQTTSTHLVVTVDLAASSQSEAVLGERVTVELPAGNDVAGKITNVSSVAQSSSSSGTGGSGANAAGNGNSGSSATIPVTIRILGRLRGAGLDQASVSVNFAEARARNVLSVPVTALLATGGDNYAVQEASAPHKLIPVTVGLFAAGFVQISGGGIYPGLQVTDSQG